MRLLILGGDERNLFLAQAAQNRGWEAALCLYDDPAPPPFAACRAVLPYPKATENGKLFAPHHPCPPAETEIEKWILPGAQVWGMPPEGGALHQALKQKECRFHDPQQCEDFQEKNAVLTAEGALWAAMNQGKECLWKKQCLVLGFGRIGRQLALRLRGLGAPVAVYARRPEIRAQAEGMGFETTGSEGLPGALGEARWIFNTVPERILDEEALGNVRKDARISELARGVDLEAAEKLGISARREGGLPGRYAPQSAAEALLDMIEQTDGA